ncbi:hypothetical protein ACHAXS_000138 [Conticribra weissflogii]
MSSYPFQAFNMYVSNNVHRKEYRRRERAATNVEWKRSSSALEATFFRGRVGCSYHNIAASILLAALLVPNTYGVSGKLRTHAVSGDIIIEGLKTSHTRGNKKPIQGSLRSQVSNLLYINEQILLQTLLMELISSNALIQTSDEVTARCSWQWRRKRY